MKGIEKLREEVELAKEDYENLNQCLKWAEMGNIYELGGVITSMDSCQRERIPKEIVSLLIEEGYL